MAQKYVFIFWVIISLTFLFIGIKNAYHYLVIIYDNNDFNQMAVTTIIFGLFCISILTFFKNLNKKK